MHQHDNSKGKVRQVSFDPVADRVAARAAELLIEGQAQELADAAAKDPDDYALTYDRRVASLVLRPVADAERRAA